MAKVNITSMQLFKYGQWRQLSGVSKSNGFIYTNKKWYCPWAPTDGVYLNGIWHILGEDNGPIIDPPKVLKTNNILIRRKDWLDKSDTSFSPQGTYKFGFRLECDYSVASDIVGWFKIKKEGSKEEQKFDFSFAKGKIPYQDWNSNEATGNRVFVSGEVLPPNDEIYEYKMSNTKDRIIT